MSLSDAISLPTNVKEAVDTVKSVFAGKHITKRIPRVLCVVSAILLTFVYFQQYWNILAYIKLEPLPMFSKTAENFLSELICSYGIWWAVYLFAGYALLLRLVVYIDTLKKTTYIRYFQTFDDIMHILASVIFLLYSLDELFYFANFGSVAFNIEVLYYIAFLYLSILFVRWLYQKNNHNPYVMSTGYYDSNNTHINEGNYVRYNNKLYKVVDGHKDILGFSNDLKKDSYVLSAVYHNDKESVFLEDAVKNKNGNLTIVK